MNSETCQIKGLYFIWNESPETPYLEAISMDENKLIDMIYPLTEKLKNLGSQGEIKIKNVEQYGISKIGNEIILTKYIYPSHIFIPNKTYCMNLISFTDDKEYVDQVLVNIENDYDIDSKEYKDFIIEINNHTFFTPLHI